MRHSLRNWLILSHILPLLIVIPLMGIALIYVLETRFLVPQLNRTISANAELIAEFGRGQPQIWNNPSYAQAWLKSMNPGLASQVMLLSPDCSLLATSTTVDTGNTRSTLATECQAMEQTRQVIVKNQSNGKSFFDDTIDVLAPVFGTGDHLIGIVRLSYPFSSTMMQLFQVRFLIVVISLIEIVFGLIIAIFLALKITKPLQKVTKVVYNLARWGEREQLPMQGPDEVKLLSEAVNLLIGRLNNLEQARRRLLSNLVHELGRPLGALRSANQAILEGADKDPQFSHELLVGMDEEMERLQNLLQNLRDHYEQALGILELDLQAVPLNEWISRLLLPWHEAARDKKLQWEVSIPPDLPTIKADPSRLAQALENLISNAIKFTPPGGTVSVSAGCEQGEVWMRVSDTGPGIPTEEQINIFNPFYRGNQGRRFHEGMGLGLSIARDITNAHGGHLELKSAAGMGSSFTISLPITKVDEPIRMAEPSE